MELKHIKLIIGLLLSVIGLIYGVHEYINNKKVKLESEIKQSIDGILQGKNLIMDGELYSAEVKLDKVPTSIFEIDKFGNIVSPTYIKSYYTLVRGGFNFIVLEKTSSNIYRLYYINAGDLAYKVNKYDEWGIERSSINSCYKRVFDYFINGYPEYLNSFIPNSKSDINNFTNIENEYYQVKSAFENSSGFSSGGNPSIKYDDFNLYFSTHGDEYSVKLNKEAVIKDYIKYIFIGIIIISALAFILFYKQKEIQ